MRDEKIAHDANAAWRSGQAASVPSRIFMVGAAHLSVMVGVGDVSRLGGGLFGLSRGVHRSLTF